MGILQLISGWIFQRTSELDAGHPAPNSSGFSSRFNTAPVYRRLPKIPPSELDEIFQGSFRFNSALFHRSNRRTDVQGGGDDGRKFAIQKNSTVAQGNIDVEPPGSLDDSSMILMEIGVDVDEGPNPNMTIGGRAQSLVEPR